MKDTETASRRRVLQTGALTGALALSGCLGSITGTRDTAARQIPLATTAPDTWPRNGYDVQNTGQNRTATPPRSSPTTAWSVPVSGTVSSVAVGPTLVYASSDEETRAITRAGTGEWCADVGGAPTYVEGRLYVSTDRGVIALDATTGEEIWRATDAERSAAQVIEAAGTVYVAGHKHVVGLHADTGARRWQLETARHPALVADDERVVIVTRDRVQSLVPGAQTDGLLEEPAPQTRQTMSPGWHPDVVSATLVGNTVFAAQYGSRTGNTPGMVRCYDLTFADEEWLTQFSWDGLGVISVTDDRVYATPYRATTDPPDGSLVVLDRASGEVQWRYDGAMLGRPVIGGDVVVTGGADPGSPTVCLSSDSQATADCSDGRNPATSGVLHAFDTTTGERLWTRSPGGSFGGYPVALVGDAVYYGDSTGIHSLQ
ncbi:outer membrane protein assembly factor BamB family protein [Halarchaeum nitratireducens]|uniref:outer membrane protein assembly factor BamB family protein n=1 Tax=Halarchaeum nitratireducens TaxID=489913 RepID=UPI001B3AE27C|nr:PQQ-binding-like beta-propeller repeat protein [Halarchaeum solikamskense]